MRKVITFLGTFPKPTHYLHQQKEYEGQVFGEAIYQFANFDEMLVFVTEQAKAKAWPVMAALNDDRIKPVDIPTGETAAEMWATFEQLTQVVEEKDTVIFDITHGLRSIPFLVFLAAAFLKSAKAVTIEAVYYGAFELQKDAQGQPRPAPVIDLSEFVTLLDWTIATDRFTRFGDASNLVKLLRDGKPDGPLMGKDLEARALGNALKKAANAIENVSLTLRLTRPLETMKASQTLVDTLADVQEIIKNDAPPFGLLADEISGTYREFALAQPQERAHWHTNLQIQLDMIQWYLEREQIVQAVTLAREWLVSLLLYHFGGQSLVDHRAEREPVENALNNVAEQQKPNPRPPLDSSYNDALRQLPQHQELGKIWSSLIDLRNDIAHAGMNPQPTDANKLCKKAHKLYPGLQAIGQDILGVK